MRIHFCIQWPTSAVGTIGREIFGRISIATILGSVIMSPGKREVIVLTMGLIHR